MRHHQIHLRNTLIWFRKVEQLKARGFQAIGKFKHFLVDNCLSLSKDMGSVGIEKGLQVKDKGLWRPSFIVQRKLSDSRLQRESRL